MFLILNNIISLLRVKYTKYFPPKGEALLHLGSLEKGAGSRRLTEGFFRKASHNKQKIPQEPLHRLSAVPLP